jgi:hypothetical protein
MESIEHNKFEKEANENAAWTEEGMDFHKEAPQKVIAHWP